MIIGLFALVCVFLQNSIGKWIILSGGFISIFGKQFIDWQYLDITGVLISFCGLLMIKDTTLNSYGDYGKHVYYTVYGLFLMLIFLKWFL